MKMRQMVKMMGFFSLSSLLVLSGCATQSTAPEKTAPAKVETTSVDQSSPAVPAIAAAPVIKVEEVAEITKPEPEPEAGSVAAVLKKMETSPYTLYWRGKNTYSYFIGGLIDAEYEPGKKFVVKEDIADGTGISCQYDSAGQLDASLEQDAKAKEACSKLMFTLDDELSD